LRMLRSLWLVLLLCGCAGPKTLSSPRPFVFRQDTFAFNNETVWDYHIDPDTGKTTHTRHQPPPSYSHHCFVLARSARQFFQHARFDGSQPVADEATYRRLIRQVASLDPQRQLPEDKKVVIPGYTNLRSFSEAQASLLKQECGGAWQSYFQRGHWRMIWPISRGHQEKTAGRLTESLRHKVPPIVHLVRFPQLSINHAVVLFEAKETGEEIQFMAYDPNNSTQPAPLIFNRAQRRFSFPACSYFAGGRVDVYQIYCQWDY